jgi:hypothetical protein
MSPADFVPLQPPVADAMIVAENYNPPAAQNRDGLFFSFFI